MEPKYLPLVLLPLELSDESAALLLNYLYDLTHTLEQHYAEQLARYHCSMDPTAESENAPLADPPF
jgi:hypothetical protein